MKLDDDSAYGHGSISALAVRSCYTGAMSRMPPTGTPHWIRLFLAAFTGASAAIGGTQFLKGHTPRYAITQGLLWGAISAAIFVAARYYHFRKGRHCAICGDLPEGFQSGPPRAPEEQPASDANPGPAPLYR